MTSQPADKTLTRIRALLAKAEDQAATPEEAELYFAKAVELMTRYGIDQAMVAAQNPGTDQVTDRLVTIDGTYQLDRQSLLASIAQELGCQVVVKTRWVNGSRYYQVHLFGHASDLERVDLLYTSLLLQSTTALHKAETPLGMNTRSFRVSWLTGFRAAVVKRLRDAQNRARQQATENQTQNPAAAAGRSVALVLADRSAAVHQALEQVYPKLRKARTRQVAAGGFDSGYQAGVQADLGGIRIPRQPPGAGVLNR